MSQQQISIGTNPNDGTGATLRAAGSIINSNFTDLYAGGILRTPVADLNYSVLPSDGLIAYTALTATRTVSLPAANSVSGGRQIIITDESGNASPSISIQLTPAGLDFINGANATLAVVTAPRGRAIAESDGISQWTIWSSTQITTPANLTSGTLLASPAVGAEEFDGTALYFTPYTASRSVIDCQHYTVLTSANNLANVATAQNIFPSGQGTLTVPGNISYYMESQLFVTRSAGTTAHTVAFQAGGTATFNNAGYSVQTNDTAAIALGAASNIWGTSLTSGVIITASNSSAAEDVIINILGWFSVNAGGTIIPQLLWSSAPGGAPTVNIGSYFRIWPIGSGIVTKVGNWS